MKQVLVKFTKLVLCMLIFEVFLPQEASSQYIRNGGFEYPAGTVSPRFDGMIDDRNVTVHDEFTCDDTTYNNEIGLSYWEDDMDYYYDQSTCQDELLHFSDWLSPLSGKYGDNTIPSKQGDAYVGLARCGLIQQQLQSSFTEGDKYYLKLALWPRTYGASSIQTYHGIPSSTMSSTFYNSTLNIYLTKSKVRYKNDQNASYCDKQEGVNNNWSSRELIGSFNVNDMGLEYDSWNVVSSIFEAPPTNYDWLVLELVTPGGENSYINVDDLSIVDFTPDACLTSITYSNGDNIPSTTRVSDHIVAQYDVTVPSMQNTKFIAGNYVRLLPNCHIESGTNSTFRAYIDGCTSSQRPSNGSDGDFGEQDDVEELPTDNSDDVKQLKSTLLVYPNPNTSGHFQVETKEIANIEVIDMYGKVLEYLPNASLSTQVDISRYPKGIYFLRVTVGEETQIKKLIFQ